MKTAKFYTAAMTSALVTASLVAACSTDSGDIVEASGVENAGEVAKPISKLSAASEEPTIEMTGKAGYDIVSFNNTLSDYSYSAMPAKALRKGASDVIADNVVGNGPYKEMSRGILGVGEHCLDKALDASTFGLWVGIKNGLLGWMFQKNQESFDVAGAFNEVNSHLSNIEAILGEMRTEVENGMKVQSYAQRLTDRRDLYGVLSVGLDELYNKIVTVVSDSVTYPTDEARLAAVRNAVQKWGDESVGTASGIMPGRQHAVALLGKIMNSVQLTGNSAYVSDYLHIYDEYAKRTLVWEQEGYAWRELMRAQDAKMVMQLSVATALYYTMVSEDKVGIEELHKKVAEYNKLVENTPIEYHSTPIYIKWGSKWAGQAFEADLASINYADVLNDKGWSAGEMIKKRKCKDKGSISRFLNEDFYKYNASRLYAGLEPYYVENPKNSYSLAGRLAMPEEWYKEVYEAYAVNGQRKSLMEIFKSVGFRFNSKELEIREFERDKFEQFFITNRRDYAVMVGGYSELRVAIPVVTANSREGILTGTVQDHDAYALKFMATNRNDRFGLLCTGSPIAFYKVTADYSDHRTFFYPVKVVSGLVINTPKIPR